MADETPSLHIDTDWKKQAQEEKRKLAEAEAAKKAQATAPAAAPSPAPGPSGAGPVGSMPGGRRGARELPQPSFATLVQSLLTQALYYMGELDAMGGQPMLNLDMAKHQIDTLGVLEDKTKNNLAPEEQKLLDTALYETRNRFVSVASQLI